MCKAIIVLYLYLSSYIENRKFSEAVLFCKACSLYLESQLAAYFIIHQDRTLNNIASVFVCQL